MYFEQQLCTGRWRSDVVFQHASREDAVMASNRQGLSLVSCPDTAVEK